MDADWGALRVGQIEGGYDVRAHACGQSIEEELNNGIWAKSKSERRMEVEG